MPGQKKPKAAGEPCIHLSPDFRCRIFGHPDRPKVCSSLQPSPEMCGENRDEAMEYLSNLETLTQPAQES